MSVTIALADLALRPATLEDAAFVADVLTATDPDEPFDPEQMRFRWENAPADAFIERHVVLRHGEPIGATLLQHPAWAKTAARFAFSWADLLPPHRSPVRLATLLAHLELRARDEGVRTLIASCRETDPFKIRQLTEAGFGEDRRIRAWALDLRERRDVLLDAAEASRAKMRAAGIALLTLAEDRGPAKYEQTWSCYVESASDVPSTMPFVAPTLEDYRKSLRRPGTREDRFWIARLGDEIVGSSNLQYPPVRGHITTAWTGTRRRVRGMGVARALKLETIAQAIALGVPSIRTGNDAENAPILHINESLGYRPMPSWIEFRKDLA